MIVTAIPSTTLATVVYDEAREVLQLELVSGATYQYFGVPRAVHEALLSAPSKGRYFNQAIRGASVLSGFSLPGPSTRTGSPDS